VRDIAVCLRCAGAAAGWVDAVAGTRRTEWEICGGGVRSGGGGGGGVDAVEAEAPGRLRARCVTSGAMRVHTVTWAGVGV
jgi:hypothetical protein